MQVCYYRGKERRDMRSYEAIREMIKATGKSMNGVSVAIGRAGNFIYEITSKQYDSRAETLTAIAGECGYRLALVPDSEQLPSNSIAID